MSLQQMSKTIIGLMAGLGRERRDSDLGQVGKEALKGVWEGGG